MLVSWKEESSAVALRESEGEARGEVSMEEEGEAVGEETGDIEGEDCGSSAASVRLLVDRETITCPPV